MTDQAYRGTLAKLYALEAKPGDNNKLDRVRRALGLLGSPQCRYRVLHIGGTNGKGSTAAMLDAILRRAGYRVGLYTSPHLVDFTERIRIDGRTVSRQEVVDRVAAIRSLLAAAGITLTFFETVTLLALDVFARHRVDIAVIEVGLGGRLDATNVASPMGTAITGVEHDHEAYLGATLSAIAREKGAIMKPGVPAVIGPTAPYIAGELSAHAQWVGAPLEMYGRDYRVEDSSREDRFDVIGNGWEWNGLTLRLRGGFQRRNAATALALLHRVRSCCGVPEAAVRSGLAEVHWPGRLDLVSTSPRVILDGAHNPAAAREIRVELERWLGALRARLVLAVMRDKDWKGIWSALRPIVSEAIVTSMTVPRCLDPNVVAAALARDVPVHVVPRPEDALSRALTIARDDEVVLVTGSLFLVGEVYAALLRTKGERGLFDPWRAEEGDGRYLPR